MAKIVGIDPGLADTGVGIVRGRGLEIEDYAFGTIRTSKDQSLADRLNLIFTQTRELFEREKPDLVVVEDVFSLSKFPRSGITLGQVCGVLFLAGCHASARCVEIPVREAKQILTGSGNASKEQLENAVRNRLKHHEPIRPFHASDALGLALIGLFRYSDRLDAGGTG
jgi:crossover junction endodeoxyribonuclease RuvC